MKKETSISHTTPSDAKMLKKTMEKLYYIELGELGEIANEWIKDNPHNNGFAKKWYVLEPKESAYPEIEIYLLSLGLKVGDKVILHSVW